MFTIILIISIKLTFLYLAYHFYKSFKRLQSGKIEELSKLKRLKTIIKIAIIAIIPLIYLSSYVKFENIFNSTKTELSEYSYEELIVGTWQCLDGNPEMTFLETGEFYFGEIEGEWFFDNDELFLNSNGIYIELPLDHVEENHIHFYDAIRLDDYLYPTPNCRKF